jgi:phosphoenolpyruvate carboxylase
MKATRPPARRLYTQAQLVDILGVSKSQVGRLLDAGLLQPVLTASPTSARRRRMVSAESVERYLRDATPKPVERRALG